MIKAIISMATIIPLNFVPGDDRFKEIVWGRGKSNLHTFPHNDGRYVKASVVQGLLLLFWTGVARLL